MTDSLGFLDAVAGLPEQLAAAHEAAGEATESDVLPEAGCDSQHRVLGMGGSGIAGDVVNSVSSGDAAGAGDRAEADTGRRASSVPGRSRFAVSYSGNTEETLSMARGASEAGADLVTVSNGGELAEPARARCTSRARPG